MFASNQCGDEFRRLSQNQRFAYESATTTELENQKDCPASRAAILCAYGVAAQEAGGHLKPVAASTEERPARVEEETRGQNCLAVN